MNRAEYIQMKAFTRQDGAFLGLFWIASFACFVASMYSNFMKLLFDVTLWLTPFVVVKMIKKYRDDVVNGLISFRRSFVYSFFVFVNAMLILAIAQWAYLQFMDNGTLVTGFVKSLNAPEMKPVLEAYGLSKDEVDQQIALLRETRPIDFVFVIFSFNTFITFFLSWFIALVTTKTKKR